LAAKLWHIPCSLSKETQESLSSFPYQEGGKLFLGKGEVKMPDAANTEEQPSAEIAALRRRIAEPERKETEGKHARNPGPISKSRESLKHAPIKGLRYLAFIRIYRFLGKRNETGFSPCQ
jgi:hypothetical protein